MRHLIIVALGLMSLLPARVTAQNARFEADSAYAYLQHLCVEIGPRPMPSKRGVWHPVSIWVRMLTSWLTVRGTGSGTGLTWWMHAP